MAVEYHIRKSIEKCQKRSFILEKADTIFGPIKIESRAGKKGSDGTFLMPGKHFFNENASTIIRENIGTP